MRQKLVDVYSYEDLILPENKTIKDKIMEKHRYLSTEDIDWYVFTYEMYESELKELGFYDIKFNFSGFYSQGDGARITCSIPYQKAVDLLGLSSKDTDDLHIIASQSRYCHENTLHTEGNDSILKHHLLIYLRNKSQDLYKSLENEYENLISNESIMEMIESNEYEFDETGKME